MHKKLYLIIGVAVIVAIAGAVFLFSRGNPTAVQTPQSSPLATQIPANTPTITKAVMSKSIDAQGNATNITTTFNAKTDKIVYAVLSLKNIAKNTKLSYVRYLNGKYVDSKVAVPTKDNISTFYFSFEKGIGDYPKGTYTLNLYVNGRHTQTLTYVFK